MLSRKFPELSATCGPRSDGIPLGVLEASTFLGAETLIPFVTNLIAIRDDVATGASTYLDMSTAASAGVTNGFAPWGASASFSASDEVWLVADQDLCELYPHVDTPAVYTGDGLEVLESLDGETFTPVRNLVDTTNGLRNAGVGRITFDVGARVALQPTRKFAKRKYIVMRPKNLTAATTAPLLSRIRGSCPDTQSVHTDRTAVRNGAITDNTFDPSDDILITDTTYTVYVARGKAKGMIWYVFQSFEDLSTMVYEYFNGSAWVAFTGLSDPSSGLENGPTTLGATAQKFVVTWDLPAVWPSATMTFSGRTYTGHMFRIRPINITQYRPSRPGFSRARVHAYSPDTAGGVYHPVAKSYSGITFESGVAPTANLSITAADANTGDGRTVTWPAGAASSWDVVGNRLSFATPITIPAGGQLMLSIGGAGVAYDATISMMEG